MPPATLQTMNLRTPIFPGSNLPTPKLPGTNLPGLNLPTSNFLSSNLQGSDLPTSNFPGSNLPTSNLPTSNLTGLNWPTSNLPTLPEFLSPLLPPSSSSLNTTFISLPPVTPQSTVHPMSFSTASETLLSSLSPKAPTSALPSAALNTILPSFSPLTSSATDLIPIVPPIANWPNTASGPILPYQGTSPSLSVVGNSNSVPKEALTTSLVTPGQLQSGPAAVPSSQLAPAAHKDVEVVRVSSALSEPSVPVATEAQLPLLPLPVPSRAARQPNGTHFHSHHGFRVRGRGAGISRPIAKFTEDFDFEAMNEKFNKDKVWGHLGKCKSKDKDDDGEVSVEDDTQYENDAEVSKAVYKKDDFFDTLSSHTINHDSQNGRTRFSEQMKIDAETFGDFPRFHRGGRGGRGYSRGDPHGGCGGYYGRGNGYSGGRGHGYSGGRGHGYSGRGRGRGMSNHGF